MSAAESNKYKSGFCLYVNLMLFAKNLWIYPEFIIKMKKYFPFLWYSVTRTTEFEFEWAWSSEICQPDPNRRKRFWFISHDRTAHWNLQIYTEWDVVYITPQCGKFDQERNLEWSSTVRIKIRGYKVYVLIFYIKPAPYKWGTSEEEESGKQ